MHRFAVLIQCGAAHFYDRLVWFGTRRDDFENLAFHGQRVTRVARFGPRELATQADDAVAQRQASPHQKPHGNGSGVPSAGGQSAKYAGLRRRFIKVEGLWIELRGKALDLLFSHKKRAGSELLTDRKIVKVESGFFLDCLRHSLLQDRGLENS